MRVTALRAIRGELSIVADALRHDGAFLYERSDEDDVVGLAAQLRSLGNRIDVVAARAKLLRDRRRPQLIERELHA